jgi:hypothetical protein
MTTARERSILARREADMLDACAEQQEKLAAAKAAYEADPTPENLAARRAVMTEVHEFRGFVRTVARVRKLRGYLATGIVDKRELTAEERRYCEAELTRLEPTHGTFADGQGAPAPARKGDAEVQAKTTRGRARAHPSGGA